ncbi:uncharacterized protein BDZ99DRAFT_466343 [Mytilinidion resinicola]|uniref:Uncharacterized protein n=1 Tax=Mytilinidion resinicola TaxID=574789 RepID=A0A6A6YC14_9PEZI|nr:uncharacterized protein BDZ99DRAFT_466343 [Mytilinidion resinicola]KAF2806053.1 hypothetical protein BDZ99DRAFT_466343 [Mytilinidion resinicola]
MRRLLDPQLPAITAPRQSVSITTSTPAKPYLLAPMQVKFGWPTCRLSPTQPFSPAHRATNANTFPSTASPALETSTRRTSIGNEDTCLDCEGTGKRAHREHKPGSSTSKENAQDASTAHTTEQAPSPSHWTPNALAVCSALIK